MPTPMLVSILTDEIEPSSVVWGFSTAILRRAKFEYYALQVRNSQGTLQGTCKSSYRAVAGWQPCVTPDSAVLRFCARRPTVRVKRSAYCGSLQTLSEFVAPQMISSSTTGL